MRWSLLVIAIAFFAFANVPAYADATVTVTVYDQNGVIQGMYVSVKAYCWDYELDDHVYYTASGLTDENGEVELTIKKHCRFDQGEDSKIETGSGIFSKLYKHYVRLSGTSDSVTVKRE